MKFVINSLIDFGRIVIERASGFVLTILIARWATNSVFGVYCLTLTIAILIDGIMTYGMDVYFIKKISRKKESSETIYFTNFTFIKVVYYSAGLAVMGLIQLIFQTDHLLMSTLVLLHLSFMFSSLVKTWTSVSIARNKFLPDFLYILLSKGSMFLLFVPACFFAKDIIWFCAASSISSAIAFVILLIELGGSGKGKFDYRKINYLFISRFAGLAAPITMTSLASHLYYHITTCYLGILCSPDAIADYNKAQKIYGLLINFPMIISRVGLPYFTEKINQGKIHFSHINLFLLAILAISSIFSLVFALAAQPILHLFFGTVSPAVVTMLQVIITGFPFLFLNMGISMYYNILNLEKIVFHGNLVKIIIYVFACFAVLKFLTITDSIILYVTLEALLFGYLAFRYYLLLSASRSKKDAAVASIAKAEIPKIYQVDCNYE